jgi:hypothetical protein
MRSTSFFLFLENMMRILPPSLSNARDRTDWKKTLGAYLIPLSLEVCLLWMLEIGVMLVIRYTAIFQWLY